LMQNLLTNHHRKFLEADGFFIGDGDMSYEAGPMCKGFYSLGIGKRI
jgi:hypothetical protein